MWMSLCAVRRGRCRDLPCIQAKHDHLDPSHIPPAEWPCAMRVTTSPASHTFDSTAMDSTCALASGMAGNLRACLPRRTVCSDHARAATCNLSNDSSEFNANCALTQQKHHDSNIWVGLCRPVHAICSALHHGLRLRCGCWWLRLTKRRTSPGAMAGPPPSGSAVLPSTAMSAPPVNASPQPSHTPDDIVSPA